ncbi:MAG TPA: hypothetical protein VHU83_12820 [Bryobacteraceae bacterium]|jgi:hypothetical protein|nr:hypothetical protein [Bryobacteraceae bacterium]
MAAAPELSIEHARATVTKEYARVLANPATKQQMLLNIYNELIAQGQQEMADFLMTFHAMTGAIQLPMQDRPNITYNITGSNFGTAAFDSQVGSINTSMNVVGRQQDGQAFAGALQELTKAVLGSPDLQDVQKKEVLDAFELVGKQAEEPPEKRRLGILKPVLESIPKSLSSASALLNLWHTFGPHITGFFGM